MVQAAQHLSQFHRPLGHAFRQLLRRKNRSVAVVACARKLTVVLWHVLSSGEPYRYAQPKSLEAKLSRLRVRVTGERRRGGVLKGTRRSERYGLGRTRAVPSLPQVLEGNHLPLVPSLSIGEMKMLERKQLLTFYEEIQIASRIAANTRKPQTQEQEEEAKPQLTQS